MFFIHGPPVLNPRRCLYQNCSVVLDYNSGVDGRPGNQPRFTRVVGNLVREVGLWQKQSGAWSQHLTAATHLESNVFFNGPHSAVDLWCTMQNTRGVSYLNHFQKHKQCTYFTMCMSNVYCVARAVCFIHGPPVFTILGRLQRRLRWVHSKACRAPRTWY